MVKKLKEKIKGLVWWFTPVSNPSYLRGRDREDHSLSLALGGKS
jgi:hypothetical protein